jgi:hypothetical protein
MGRAKLSRILTVIHFHALLFSFLTNFLVHKFPSQENGDSTRPQEASNTDPSKSTSPRGRMWSVASALLFFGARELVRC